MDIEIRNITATEIPAFRRNIATGFGADVDEADPQGRARFDALFDRTRTNAAFDGGDLIGTSADFEFDVTVPGGNQIPMAGLTVVTVQATHRRRGVLRAMMRAHLDAAHRRGEAVAGLWASEVPIYGRFGYGAATDRWSIAIDAPQAGPPRPAEGRVRLVEQATAAGAFPGIYDAVRAHRPGMLSRTEDWWAHRLFYDPERWRAGATSLRYGLVEAAGVATGYVMYRQKSERDEWYAGGELRIDELMAATPDAHRTLWAYVMNIDLFPNVTYWNLPIDDPLRWSLTNSRKLKVVGFGDSLWVRLIDVPAALARRAYAIADRLVIEVVDHSCPWNEGTYALDSGGAEVTVERVDQAPDVALDVAVLGSLYLGGRGAPALADAGLITGEAAAVGRLDAMFRWHQSPWCPEVF